jgi:GNAT superfamily N-acetyltransferase
VSDVATRVRPARRSDAGRVAELRFGHLAEAARLDPRLALAPDARERVAQAVATWASQEDRAVVVAERVVDGAEPEVVGYATGRFAVWPPVLRAQRVGELSECFVVSAERGRGLGRALVEAVAAALRARGADVLRAPVPTRHAWAADVLRARGFAPSLRVLERPLGAR